MSAYEAVFSRQPKQSSLVHTEYVPCNVLLLREAPYSKVEIDVRYMYAYAITQAVQYIVQFPELRAGTRFITGPHACAP